MTALREHIEAVPLVDHHGHGCRLESGYRSRFANALNEANTEPLAKWTWRSAPSWRGGAHPRAPQLGLVGDDAPEAK